MLNESRKVNYFIPKWIATLRPQISTLLFYHIPVMSVHIHFNCMAYITITLCPDGSGNALVHKRLDVVPYVAIDIGRFIDSMGRTMAGSAHHTMIISAVPV